MTQDPAAVTFNRSVSGDTTRAAFARPLVSLAVGGRVQTSDSGGTRSESTAETHKILAQCHASPFEMPSDGLTVRAVALLAGE